MPGDRTTDLGASAMVNRLTGDFATSWPFQVGLVVAPLNPDLSYADLGVDHQVRSLALSGRGGQ